MTRAQLLADLTAFDAIDNHRTATDGDALTSKWLIDACRTAGCTAVLRSFPFARRHVLAAQVRLADGTAIDGTPLFDAPDTPSGGTTAVAGALGRAGTMGIARFSPQDGHPLTRALHAARVAGTSRGIVAVSAADGIVPGLAVLNAERYGAPFGPPVLQVGSAHRHRLEAIASAGETVTLEISSRWEETTFSNVDLVITGRDESLAPLVVMTPKSGWWNCTSERGGGIATWLACARRLARTPPLRTVHFTANSGHELGHLGMRRHLAANTALLREAHCWVHLGANFAARDSRILLQADSDARMTPLVDAFAAHSARHDDTLPHGTRPFGEARDIHDGGGRYLSIVGSNPWFHHPDDRLQTSVDLARCEPIVAAFVDSVSALANA